jgi:hypothetical protein
MKRNSYFCRPLDHDLEFWMFIPTTHYFHTLMFYYENNSYDKIYSLRIDMRVILRNEVPKPSTDEVIDSVSFYP